MTFPTIHWRKSSYSGGGNNACIELGMQWHKSSFSGDNNACAELVGTLDAVRDSKNPEGPILHADLHGLLTVLQEDRLSR